MEKMREARNGLLCAVLTAQLIFSPVLGAAVQAAGVTPDPNAAADKRPSMEAAPNGVPVVNITAANGSGLSHNQYHDFNVHQQGLILNNSSSAANSQLGGILAGNPNFNGNHGAEARAVLNEVTSANRSRIEGYIEVNGRAADVILANPNGVTVNGGGFINVPRATITTGKPQVDGNGALCGYEVRQGDIRIEGAGVNADNTDAFTLLARTAGVEAQVRANSLAVVTGKNHVAADGTVTPLADAVPADPSTPAVPPASDDKPEVGIDSSALGGMYANRITLIATEKGVGVNLEGAVQSADQMVITADGKLRLREAASGGDAILVSKGDIELTGAAVTAARDLTGAAENVRLEKGVFEPQYEARKAKKQAENVAAGAASAPAPEKASGLYAGGNLSVRAATLLLDVDARMASGMDSSGGLTKDGKTSIAVNTLKAEQAQLLSGGSISIAAKTAGAKSSTIAAKGDVLLSGGEFNLENSVAQGERVGLDVEHVGMTQKSKAEAFTDLAVRATLAELNDASLSAGSDLILDVGTALFDARSSLSSGNDLFLRGTDVTVDGAFLAAGQDLEYQGDKLSNINGVLYAARDQRLFASGLLLNDGGEIYAGRDILIADADGKGENVVRNLSGVISAGNEIAINAKTVENKKREFQVVERGKHISYNEWYECNKPLLGHGCDRRQLWYYVNVYEDYILKDSPSAQLLAGGDILIGAGTLENHYSTIAAGNNLVVKADNVENKDAVLQRTRTVKETMKGWDSDDDFTGEYFRSYNETYEEIGRSPSVLSANSGLYLDVTDTFNNYSDRQGISLPTDHTVGAGYPFAGSPMFHPSAAPGHHYLIETNPMFTNMGLFYGSDYFLSRIGLDQNRQQVVLLGDAFYETRLVQQEILSATGRRFLDGYSSDADQMRGLMDAAAAQAQGLELTAGVALTPDQVAALTQDIIWLVEEEHMGEKVLVPHLYLASATQADIMPGGGVQAKNVYVNAGKGIVNEGLISGESVNLASVNIENTGGLLRGGTLNLTALNDITNNSGHLKGGDITLAAGGDIVSQTLTLADQGNSAHRHVQAQAGIEATGSVTAVAGNDLAIRGSSLNAGGDVALAAGRDLTVGTVTEEFHLDGGSKSWEHRVTHTGSTVAAGGNLNMAAGRDLTVAGSQVGAGGDAQLAAGGNLSVVAVQDTFSSFVKASSGKGGLFSSSSKSTYTQDYRSSKSSTVASGGNLSLLAGVSGLTGAPAQTGHASVVGSNLLSGKDLTVAASGNVNVASSQNSSYFSHTKSTVGALGLSSSSKKEGNSSVTQVASNLMGQNVTLDAGKSVSVTASNLAAVDSINLTARDGDVAVVDGANQSASWYYKKQTGFGLGGGGSFTSFYGTEGKKEQSASSTSQASSLAAGQDINLTAARDAAIVGSSLSAGNNVTINAGRDANILGGASTSSHSKEKFSSGFGVEGILGLDKTSFFMGYQETAKGNANANTRNAASQITANKDITVNAGQNVNLSGSRLAAAQDLNMAAGKDINLLQATDTASASQYEKTLRAGLSLTLEQNLTSNAQKVYTSVKDVNTVSGPMDGVDKANAVIKSGESLASSQASASLTLGVNSSWKSGESHSSTAVPDELSAGRDMTLAAGQDLTMQGTQAQAGRDMTLAAGRDLDIHAAESSAGSSSDGGSFGAGVGVKATAGTKGYSLGMNGNVNLAGNEADGNSHRYINAKVLAGEKLTTVSGQDTTVAGANLTAKDVDMTVGRNLTVASKQDTSSSSSSSYNAGGGFTTGYGAAWDIGSENLISQAGSLASAGAALAGDGGPLDQAAGLIGAGSLAAGDAHLPPKKNYNENYHANLSGTVSEGHSNMVGEQTSILGSDSVNIYTEGNTHVAGAIIAALNDNLKLDTGTLSYENLVGKTTQTSTSAGINWNYSPEQKSGDTGKDVTQPEDVNIGEMETSNQSTQSQREATTQKAKEEQKKKNRQEKYRNLPEWMGALFGVMDDTQDWWNTTKKDTLYGVTPGKFAHIEQETTQTAYATIGKGEIIVRNNPGQSLDGLNRDPSQAMKTEQTADVNIDWKPAFSYADDLLSGWGWPNNITGTFNFFADPKAFLNDLQDTLAKSIPLLKRPEQKKENPTAPAAQTPASTPTPSTSGPQAAAQH